MSTRRLTLLLFLAGVMGGVMIAGFLSIQGCGTSEATRLGDVVVARLNDVPQGYRTIVCSTFVNYDTGGYALIAPPSGYVFHQFDILSVKPGAAQLCSLRVWTSLTDSTNLLGYSNNIAYGPDSCMPLNFTSGANEHFPFPIKCAQISICNIAATDDFMVIGYAKTGTTD